MTATETPTRTDRVILVGLLLLCVPMAFAVFLWAVYLVTGTAALVAGHPLSWQQEVALWAAGVSVAAAVVLAVVTGDDRD